MVWTKEFQKVGGRRSLVCHKASEKEFEFRIRVLGGFCTVKEWRLDVICRSRSVVSGVRFWKQSEAVKWAEDFMTPNGTNISSFRVMDSYF